MRQRQEPPLHEHETPGEPLRVGDIERRWVVGRLAERFGTDHHQIRIGADDYVTKPFSVRELMARVKAVLRRVSSAAAAPEIYRFSDVEVNIRSNEVRRDGKLIDLSAKEFALLAYFIAHPVETLSRDRLLDAVWGYENYPTTRTVDTHIVHLRQKLEPNPEEPRFILTVHGSGYKFVG